MGKSDQLYDSDQYEALSDESQEDDPINFVKTVENPYWNIEMEKIHMNRKSKSKKGENSSVPLQRTIRVTRGSSKPL